MVYCKLHCVRLRLGSNISKVHLSLQLPENDFSHIIFTPQKKGVISPLASDRRTTKDIRSECESGTCGKCLRLSRFTPT